jgi:hypothetical protein
VPAQCPECGRFLRRDLVESLDAGPAPCPGCGTPLDPERFTASGEAPGEALTSTGEPQAEVVAHTPDEVAAAASGDRDPLAGWDQGTEGLVGLGGQHERDIVIALEPQQAAVAGLLGALLGALVSRRTGRGALLGAIAGILAGAVARGVGEARQLR